MEKMTEILCCEHRIILDKLAHLEKALELYALEELDQAVRFFDEQLPLHRMKEEQVLFPEVAKHFPPNAGPVCRMIEEHYEEQKLLEAIHQGLMDGDRGTVVEHGRQLIAFLRNHIWKEEHMLFPLAEEWLTLPERQQVREALAEVHCCEAQ